MYEIVLSAHSAHSVCLSVAAGRSVNPTYIFCIINDIWQIICIVENWGYLMSDEGKKDIAARRHGLFRSDKPQYKGGS